jgi:hypothetical protein
MQAGRTGPRHGSCCIEAVTASKPSVPPRSAARLAGFSMGHAHGLSVATKAGCRRHQAVRLTSTTMSVYASASYYLHNKTSAWLSACSHTSASSHTSTSQTQGDSLSTSPPRRVTLGSASGDHVKLHFQPALAGSAV